MTLSGASTSGQSGPGSDGNAGVHRIPQNFRTGCFMLYQGHTLTAGSYPSADMQSAYSTVPDDWTYVLESQFIHEDIRKQRGVLVV